MHQNRGSPEHSGSHMHRLDGVKVLTEHPQSEIQAEGNIQLQQNMYEKMLILNE